MMSEGPLSKFDPSELNKTAKDSGIFAIPIASQTLWSLVEEIRSLHESNLDENEPENVTVEDISSTEGGNKIETTYFKYLQKLRIAWATETDLVIHCIGFSVGIGNIWRFPYLAFRNGGGAFLFPYLVVTFLISYPLYYMELILGQYSRLDPLSVWDFCPFFKGIGVSIMLCTLVIQVYYTVVMAWSLFYVLQTFSRVLPWSKCSEWWGADEHCFPIQVVKCNSSSTNASESIQNVSSFLNESKIFQRIFAIETSISDLDPNLTCGNVTGESAADQFWRKYVLAVSSGLDEVGTIKWDLAVSLLATWIIICVLVITRHHIKIGSKFKTIYFTALYPFVILGVYFMYVATLPGAMKGLKYFLLPKWTHVSDISVWSEAAGNSMYSVGLGMGGLVIFGGKNRLHYDTARCAFISVVADVISSMLAATVVFMVVGFMSEIFKLRMNDATLAGHGLVFITFPSAALMMGLPQLWAFLFFVMLFALATDASIAMTETVVLGLGVLFFPTKADSKILVIGVCCVLFLLGLSCVSNGGIYVLHILDYFAGGHSLLATVLLESVAFGWGLGMAQPSTILDKMQGSKVNIFMKTCWRVVAPVALLNLFIFTVLRTELPPLFKKPLPAYASTIGWSIVIVILLPVPIYMVYVFAKHREDSFKLGPLWKEAVRRRGEDT